jgi:hypothetical protein
MLTPKRSSDSCLSEHAASLIKLKPRIARRQLASIAIPKIAKEISFPFSVREELGVHLRRIEARHRTTIKSHSPRCENEVASLQRAIAESGFIDQGLVAHEVRTLLQSPKRHRSHKFRMPMKFHLSRSRIHCRFARRCRQNAVVFCHEGGHAIRRHYI